jgi:hypothetical protein
VWVAGSWYVSRFRISRTKSGAKKSGSEPLPTPGSSSHHKSDGVRDGTHSTNRETSIPTMSNVMDYYAIKSVTNLYGVVLIFNIVLIDHMTQE